MISQFKAYRRRISPWIVWAALAGIGLVLLVIFQGRAPGPAKPRVVDTEIAGVNLTYYDFDENNRKKLEIKCLESKKKDENQLLLKGVTATLFNPDKLDKDIHVTAAAGTASNNFYDFFIHGRARIVSSAFSLASNSFLLKDLDILTSKEKVDFKLKGVEGLAARGLQYFINHKVLKLFAARGVWIRAGRPYDFQCRVFWVLRKKGLLILEKETEVAGSDSLVRSDWLSMQFDPEFDNLQSASSTGHSFFRAAVKTADGREQSREIAANLIIMNYDPQGRLQRLRIHGDGVISLAAGENSGRVQSEAIEISLNAETQALEKVRTLARGALSSRGRDNVTVDADSLLADYGQDGTLATVQAEGTCVFHAEDFSGTSDRLDYDAANARMQISGKEASIVSNKNVFHSSEFILLSQRQRLSTDQGVSATLRPEKKSVLLGAEPVFVTASALEMGEHGKVARFKGSVNLFQGEIEIHAGELLFDSAANRISCRGGADLKFTEDGELVTLHGSAIAFDAAGSKIVIEGDARLLQGPNALSARRIELSFSGDNKLQNIDAADHVAFSKKDIAGKAELLHWEYVRQTILFKNSAEIMRKGAGTTRGQELRFDLGSNQITVSGGGDRSETTIRQGRP